MIRTIRRLIATDGGDNKEWVELTMLSSDAKPTSGIINGSIATEVDTGNVFFFDETAGEWVEQFSFQNAGGGGGGLPDYSEASEGDVLSIDSNGDPAWAPPSGGGGVDAVIVLTETGYDEDTDTTIYQPEAKAGTYANLKAKLESGMPLNIQFALCPGVGFYFTISVDSCGIAQIDGNPVIEISATEVRNLINGDDRAHRIRWAADNTLDYDFI